MMQHAKMPYLIPSIVAPVLLQLCCVANAEEYRYAVFDLGDLGGDAANAFGINDEGTVVGCAWLSDNFRFHPVIFSVDRSPWDLGTFGGLAGTCYEISNDGAVVGWAESSGRDHLAFRWDGGILTRLSTLGGSSCGARSISESAGIVGWSFTERDEQSHAALWQIDQVIDLNALNGYEGRSLAWDINESGLIVGYSSDYDGWNTAVYWDPDHSIHRLVDLGGVSYAYAVNDLGIIVGYAGYSTGGKFAILWDENRGLHNLQDGQPEIGSSVAFGINNKNQVVGYANQSDGMIWQPGRGMQLLKDLVPPKMRLRMEVMHDINEHGQITGIGEEPYGLHWYRAILLSPVEPELSLSDPAPGLAGETNTWTITGAQPGSKITFAYSTKGGGTVVPGCDKLDAVLQINNPKIMRSAVADANGEATIEMFVPAQARNIGDILFQAVSVKDCEESQLVVFSFD